MEDGVFWRGCPHLLFSGGSIAGRGYPWCVVFRARLRSLRGSSLFWLCALYALHEHQALLGCCSQLQDLLRELAALLEALLDLLLKSKVRRPDLLELTRK